MIRFNYMFILLSFSISQVDYLNWYNHPELEWETIETENFIIHFHNGTERSAREAAYIAEHVYPSITELYDYKPDSKTIIVMTDYEDYSNGVAYYNFNKMIISARPADFYLRGSHRWLQNVITHEFTHIVQVGASLKYSRFIPYSAIQVMSYADEKRQDVVYGFPNNIISYPIAAEIVPPWFAEGTAQIMYSQAYFDYWDSTRDMILRDRVFYNNLLSFDQMHSFGKSGMGHECVYNQGFSLVKYIVDNYGEESLGEITSELSKPLQYSMDKALEKTIGISGYSLYDNWKHEIDFIFSEQIKNIKDNKNYTVIESDGFSNFHPEWSPLSQKIAFLSDKEHDYFGRADLFIYNLSDSSVAKIQSGVRTTPTWINDSLIVYSKRSKHNQNGSKFFNLYSYDLTLEEEQQLTEDMRLISPIFDNKKEQIYAINTYDGTSNIIAGNLDFSSTEQLTDYNNGIQIFSLTLDDSLIIYDAVVNHERDLYYFNISTKEDGIYKAENWDVRDPSISGQHQVYSTDKNGIFNLYYKNDSEEGYITNLIGGAFMPSVSNDGKIVFSLYENGKFKLALMENIEIIKNHIGYHNNLKRSDFENEFSVKDNFYNRPSSAIMNNGVEVKSKVYKDKMMGLFFIPRITIDYNTFKPGIYFFDNEYIGRTSLVGGLSMNSKKDLDFSMFFDYNKNKASYYFNFYWMTKHLSRIHPYINSNHEVIPSLNYHVDYKYELFSADIGSRLKVKNHKFWIYYTYSKYRQYNYPTLIQTYFFNEETIEELSYKYAHDYYRGHSLTFDYNYDGRSKDFLYRYTMFPKNGFNINASISVEKNRLFEGFKANDQYGGFLEDLKAHNVVRYKFDITNYWNLKRNDDLIIFKNNVLLNILSKDNIDEFLYFFGGGILGMKGYTYFEPTLQGTDFFLISNTITKPLFKEKNYKFGWFYLNSSSLSITHQFGKASNGSIKVYSGKFIDNQLNEDVKNYLQLSYNYDALDVNDNIPDNLEEYIYPDIYHRYDVVDALDESCIIDDGNNNVSIDNHNCNEYSIKELKNRYSSIKQSIGLEIKLLGFSFYSYPTAITYEYHIPIEDPWNKNGQQYLRILFDFADLKR